MARSLSWKGPFVDGYLLKKAEAARSSGVTRSSRPGRRRSTILPQFVGLTFGVYNGHKHVPVNVSEDMVGHKFGEFCAKPDLLRSRGRQKVEEEVRWVNIQARVASGQRSEGCNAQSACEPAEAQPGCHDHSWQEGRNALADLTFSQPRLPRCEEDAGVGHCKCGKQP